jgi:hypothetical protein
VRWKYWRNRCAKQCLPPPLFVTQKGCQSEFQTPPIKSFTSKIAEVIENVQNKFYYRLAYCQDVQGQHFEHYIIVVFQNNSFLYFLITN